jgi:hypothetical protein
MRLGPVPATYRKVAEQIAPGHPDIHQRFGDIVSVPGLLWQALHRISLNFIES